MELTDAQVAPFFYWINERHHIYLKKEHKLPWPWTEDKILQEYAFCNVFRELDKVTIAFKEMLAKPYAEHPHLWFAYCLARQINWPETVQDIVDKTMFPLEWSRSVSEDAYAVMQQRKAEGKKVYTGAYMIRGDIWKEGDTDNNKAKYTLFKVLLPVWEAYNIKWVNQLNMDNAGDTVFPFITIESLVKWLSTFHGWAGFMAYEVATDLRHTRYLCNAPDIMTYANAGPGAKRGLNRLFGRKLDGGLTEKQSLEEMQHLLSISPTYCKAHVPNLEMRDIEHSLCEVDKYLRVKNGEGRIRAKYKRSVA